MITQVSIKDICSLLNAASEMFNEPDWKETAGKLAIVETIKGQIVIKKPLMKIGCAEIRVDLKEADGCLEFDIQSIKILGIPDLFGILRVKVAKAIVEAAESYKWLKVWKHTNGNLRVLVPKVRILLAGIMGDSIVIEFSPEV